MNTFASLLPLEDYQLKKVRYYTVRYEDEEQNLFEEFLEQHYEQPELQNDVEELVYWLDKIGEEVGAFARYFRPEKKASALPPPARYLQSHNLLRLYCHRLSDHVVILFSGGLQTQGVRFAQDCPVVGPKFREANQLAAAIDRLMQESELQLSEDLRELLYQPEMEITL